MESPVSINVVCLRRYIFISNDQVNSAWLCTHFATNWFTHYTSQAIYIPPGHQLNSDAYPLRQRRYLLLQLRFSLLHLSRNDDKRLIKVQSFGIWLLITFWNTSDKPWKTQGKRCNVYFVANVPESKISFRLTLWPGSFITSTISRQMRQLLVSHNTKF